MGEEVEKLPAGAPGCGRCAALEAVLKKALERIATLEERLGQNSKNSHKPPSQDPPDAPPRERKEPTGRKPGGQPGHEGKNRGLLPPEQVQRFEMYIPTECERCGAPLSAIAAKLIPPPPGPS